LGPFIIRPVDQQLNKLMAERDADAAKNGRKEYDARSFSRAKKEEN